MMSWAQQPLACFVAGVLVPTLTYYYFYVTRSGRSSRNAAVDPNAHMGEWDDIESDEEGDDNSMLMGGDNPSASWTIHDSPFKMVLCVNTSLGMGKGE
jgi:hypothetical protein